MPDLTLEQVRALAAGSILSEQHVKVAAFTTRREPLGYAANVICALATEVLAQRERRCGTCQHFANEDGNDVCQHLRLAHVSHSFGCTDWTAKEGA
jgi:hypothetical protein